MNIYTDGSGDGRYCYVADEKKPKISRKSGITHNEAEYIAIIAALKENFDRDIRILSDSQLAVRQLNKKYKIKEYRLKQLAEEVWKQAEGRNVTFVWIPRERNKAGKVLG